MHAMRPKIFDKTVVVSLVRAHRTCAAAIDRRRPMRMRNRK